jgi:hypothetical protein
MTEIIVSPRRMLMYAIVSLVKEWSPVSPEFAGITSGGIPPDDIKWLKIGIIIYG